GRRARGLVRRSRGLRWPSSPGDARATTGRTRGRAPAQRRGRGVALSKRTVRMRRTVSLLATLALGGSLMAAPTVAGANPPDGTPGGPPAAEVPVSDTGSYVVVMEGDPLVTTEGRDGVQSARARNRGQQMRAQHARAARDAGVEIVNDYVTAANGFSAAMSHEQAEALAARKDVQRVIPDVMRYP